MKYYVLIVEEDVFPVVSKPFKSNKKRNDEARACKQRDGDENGIYWLNISRKGKPETGAYTGGFFSEGEGHEGDHETPRGDHRKGPPPPAGVR